jgi:purine-nucleoside/S-methyl-5'-thioadenosine phosphorylase / adenosine deaminase
MNGLARAIKTRSSRRGSSPRSAERIGAQSTSSWTIRRARGLQIVESHALAQLGWLVHGFSTRPGGESVLSGERVLNLGFTGWDDRERVAANRAKFLAALPARDMRLVTLRQFHFDVIHVADEPVPGASNADAPRADALATRRAGLLLGVQTADCAPILLADTRHRVVAAIHAGWRGTLARIAVKTLGRMRLEFGTRPRDVVAALGPAIGRCCYEVGSDVARSYAAQFPNAAEWFDGPFDQLAYGEDPLWLPWLTMMPPGHVPPAPRVQLDLRACNRCQLIDVGVPEQQIDVSDLCTACQKDLLFSYRREGSKTGRMMAVIGVPGN